MSLSAKRMEHLEYVDNMAPGLRACVHEFGYPIVKCLLEFGIRKPNQIRQIVNVIWNGARQSNQSGGAVGSIDFMLSRGPVSTRALQRMLFMNNMTIVKFWPSRAMIEASMAEVSGHNVRCTREEKHRRRLRAAIMAEARKAVGE